MGENNADIEQQSGDENTLLCFIDATSTRGRLTRHTLIPPGIHTSIFAYFTDTLRITCRTIRTISSSDQSFHGSTTSSSSMIRPEGEDKSQRPKFKQNDFNTPPRTLITINLSLFKTEINSF